MRVQPLRRELRFLDPPSSRGSATLELRARTIVEGFLSGLHRSPLKGFSVEFAEYRQYLPATISRRSTGRSSPGAIGITSRSSRRRPTSKGYLLLDVSASMGYGSGP